MSLLHYEHMVSFPFVSMFNGGLTCTYTIQAQMNVKLND